MPRSRSRSRSRGRRRRSRSRDRRDRRDDRGRDRSRRDRDRSRDRRPQPSSRARAEEEASKRRRDEARVPEPVDVLNQDDGIVVDEAEVEAFLASDDEDAREAKRAAERRKRRQAIERKHAAAKEAPQPIVEDPSKAQEEQSARDKAVKYEVTPLGLTEVKPDDDAFDMFTGEGDIDAPAPVKVGKRATAAQLLAGELGEEEQANWDDTDGYYMARPGETIDGRYRVLGVVGRGVFSSVLKARDEVQEKEKNEPCYVAVKMIRNNETMTKAAVLISASRGAAVPSRHRRDSCPSDEVVGGFFFDFEAIRTESRDRDAPRRRQRHASWESLWALSQ